MLLNVQNLTIRTPTHTLVEGLSLTLNEGQTLAIVGESGSGKTLSSLAIMGLLPPDLSSTATHMQFQGQELQTLPKGARRLLRGKAMSMIFQEPATALNPVLTCGAQVEEMFQIHTNLSRKERQTRTRELFEKVKLPSVERMAASYPHQLSGGQRQRVMIAMALALKPKLLIADEPTTALDVTVQAEILKLVKDLQKEMGMAMLWVTHDFGVVKHLADTTLVMEKGKKVEEAPTAKLLQNPSQPYTQKLLSATLSLASAPSPHPSRTEKRGELMEKNGEFAEKNGPILVAKNLSLSYRKKGLWPWSKGQELQALKHVSLSLNKGQTIGIVGESGSGKSTLARVLTRLAEPEGEGASIFLKNENFLTLRGEPFRKARRHIQMVFQDPSSALNPKLTIRQSMEEGIAAHNLIPKAERTKYIQGLIAKCGLPEDSLNRYPHQFSGGQKQRICIARALALKPEIIVCDEAVSALDVSIQAQILELLAKLQKETGTSFIFISHDLRVISHLSHHVLVMKNGEVVESGPTSQVFGKPKHPYTKQLLAAVI